MTKIIAAGTLLSALFLDFAAYFTPIYPATWFASGSIEFAIIRGVIVVLLAALILTNPPRKIYLRAILGMAAIIIFVASSVMLSQFKLAMFDFFLLALASTNFAIAAIEPDAKEILATS